MTDRERVLPINAYGDVITTAKVKRLSRKHQAVYVSAPGYLGRTVVLDFDAAEADVVLLMMDPRTAKGPGLVKACTENLWAAADKTYVDGVPLIMWLRGSPVKAAQDRCYWELRDTLERDIAWLIARFDRTGVFERVKDGGKLHKPHEEGFELVGSWKTTRGAPDLQVTLWEQVTVPGFAGLDRAMSEPVHPNFVAELDLDLETGIPHVFEAIGNMLSGDKTHPYAVVQLLAWEWGVVAFRLEAGESPPSLLEES